MADQPNTDWPEGCDQAFTAGPNWDAQCDVAFLRQAHCGDWLVADGFKDAADQIVSALTSGEIPGPPDRFFYPVAYLYRHFIELTLKDILRDAVKLGLTQVDDCVMKRHNLHRLWNPARAALATFWAGADRAPLDAAERIVLQFHHLDRSGQETRYATTTDGAPHLTKAPAEVDFVNLREVVGRLCRFLKVCSYGLDGAVAAQDDAASALC